MRRKKLHKHHTIGFESVEKIDWHLRNLWTGGWMIIEDLTPIQHRKRHKKLNRHSKRVSRFSFGSDAAAVN